MTDAPQRLVGSLPGAVCSAGAIEHTPTPESVREQLSRITASKALVRSKDLCRFLHFAAEQVLSNQGGGLKEYTIGIAVFGRGDAFNPAIDPIVRVQARRLRRKLIEYYGTEGRNDRVLVEMPVGGYVPVFRGRLDFAGPSAHLETETPVEGALPGSEILRAPANVGSMGAPWSGRTSERAASTGYSEAQNLCRMALACSREATPDGLRRSIRYYELALEVDPECPPAHAAMAVIQAFKAFLGEHSLYAN
jgi:hypothetical protein